MQHDEKHCPLCGQENHCMAGTGEENHCWCMTAKIPKEILELVPQHLKGKHCICQNCVEKYREK
ncbi:cysteine-rich CWC family protein [Rummeliibacillus sp. SL167]|uniref:cysteine-rich CWC family protein n=1 Tax=Rummeliibacillus sp. SL167 TaxID=2579792 RepID=UPI0011B60BCB|nr:cysteine-rich CWC family protein [Rummeliibacillus sp. SL167]